MSIKNYIVGGVAGILVGGTIAYTLFAPYKSKINSLEQENKIYQDSIAQLNKQIKSLDSLFLEFIEQDLRELREITDAIKKDIKKEVTK